MELRSPRQTEILDVAQRLVQMRGYNGFSFGDLAEAIGVKSAAIHYHFPTKTDLVRSLMSRYRERLHLSLAKIDEQALSPRHALERFIQLFQATLRPNNCMCLCGMLATELTVLPSPLQEDVRAFFNDNEAWLARVLGEGRKAKVLEFEGSSAAAARCVYSALHGAMLSAHAFDDPSRLTTTGRWLLDALLPPEMDALLVQVQARGRSED
ncbi:TetR/AcrR family transcriptional regulator [Humisphaera borealis]|uniref:TetR/AcrR family transcriptional regulator n=1 Tax=Humisphaera borealis TaxID=2807512 RepID=A0A7M2WWU5_9BACT|nr:TetR/AcrR family transcriptional regulator [Humisphaera borealis]QOV89672.1 TetR/AcrR family transcriptional regulator [Humisphaera borealis]